MTYIIHRVDNNPGDLWSSPRHYFQFPQPKLIDIFDIKALEEIPQGANCILGGGGLIKQIFQPSFDILFRRKCKIVFWALGERWSQDLNKGWIDEKKKKLITPAAFNPFLHLVSMRSYEPGIEWLPCASCNHTIFDRQYPSVKNPDNIKILEHKKVNIENPEGYPKIKNDPSTIDEMVGFIAGASILITNSYHAMYWAYLLGVTTVCIPFSSTHYSFCDKMIYSKL